MQALAAMRRVLSGGERVLQGSLPPAFSLWKRRFRLNESESGGVDAFFEEGRGPDTRKGTECGRSWRMAELKIKSWDDLHKLWYVLYREKNMLLSQLLMLRSQNLRMGNRERFKKVKLSMARIKYVLHERALADGHRTRRNILKLLVNGR